MSVLKSFLTSERTEDLLKRLNASCFYSPALAVSAATIDVNCALGRSSISVGAYAFDSV